MPDSVSQKKAPSLRDPELNRVVGQIYDHLNEIVNSVKTPTSGRSRDTEGVAGDLRVTKLGLNDYALEMRHKDGWVVSSNGIFRLPKGGGNFASLSKTGVVAGSYTNVNVTVDDEGRISTASSGAGPVPLTRILTINGQAQDLSADRTWTITVTGTANRIAVTGGAGLTPTIDIDASYVGQASITTLGTIGIGTWQGTIVGVTYGGTGANLSATGGAGQYVKQSSAGAAFTVGTIPASDIASGAALTRVDDTNVTLVLGGSPTIALLAATSLTLGWTGTLADSRLSVTGVSAATYGSATQVPQIAVGLTGRITSASNITITPAVGSLTGRSNLVGTSNQVNLSASGTNALVGGNNITLSLPQDYHTAATPQLARLGLGAAADANHLLLISGGTITSDKHLIDASVTWNNAAVGFTALKLNVTNTASINAMVFDFQIGGVSKFVMRSDGSIGINAGSNFTFRLQVNNAAAGTSDIAAWFNDQAQADNNAVRHIFYVKGETSTDGANQPLQIAAILGGATGVTVADTWLGYLDFYVANTGAAIAKKMRVRGDGQIEIPALTHCIANFDGTGLTSEIAHVADGSVLSSKGTTTTPAYRTVLGTTNQITVTLAAGSYTFSTPQNIHTSATPQFTRMGLGAAADAGYALYCASQNILMYNGGAIWGKDSGGTPRWVIGFYTDNYVYIGETSNMNGIIFRPGAAEKMRLTSTGLGIGVTPTVDLHVARGVNGGVVAKLNNTSAGTGAYTQVLVQAETAFATFVTSYSTTYTTSGINIQASSAFSGDGAGGLSLGATNAAGIIRFWCGGATERARLTEVGNLKIAGTATRATTEGTNHLDIFNGTAPVGTLTNGISLYSTAGELRVMDAAGNATLLSPHDKEGYWIYDSIDSKTGRRLMIDMEKFMKFLNRKFGTDFIHEYMGVV